MAFEKGNTYGKGRVKGSKNRKTIAKESLEKLTEIGINPLETSKEIIDSLVKDTELKNSEKLNLLSTMTSLFKYELLTRESEIKLDELQQENEELLEENKELRETFIGSPQDLLKKLKEENENERIN
jgi:predicted nuclease with TOPRIM domain